MDHLNRKEKEYKYQVRDTAAIIRNIEAEAKRPMLDGEGHDKIEKGFIHFIDSILSLK